MNNYWLYIKITLIYLLLVLLFSFSVYTGVGLLYVVLTNIVCIPLSGFIIKNANIVRFLICSTFLFIIVEHVIYVNFEEPYMPKAPIILSKGDKNSMEYGKKKDIITSQLREKRRKEFEKYWYNLFN